MTQSVTVQVPQTLEELQGMKVKELRNFVAVIKYEDTDALPEITVKSLKPDLITALAEYMGFNESVEEEITEEVNKEIEKQVDMDDVLDFGDDVPSLEIDGFVSEDAPIEPEPETSVEEAQAAETTGDAEVDSILEELGLDGLDELEPAEILTPEAIAQAEAENNQMADMLEEFAKGKEKEKKPKKPKKVTIPMDAPIPVRQYQSLLLGIYGNILEEREEPFPAEHKYAGLVHEEIKLERFNAKAHETFRNTKGHMHLLYTNVGSKYLLALKKPDGTIDPVLEVANKGRGHLRCKQIANHLQVAYNEKLDQEIISGEEYGKLADQIELMSINIAGEGA